MEKGVFVLGAYDGWQIANALWDGARMLLENPLLYLGTALMYAETYRTSRQERGFFGFRLTRAWRSVGLRWVYAFIAGLIASAISVASGLTLDVWGVGAVVVLSILLACIRLRLCATVYAIAILVALSRVLLMLPVPSGPSWLRETWLHLARQPVSPWLAAAALCLLLEVGLLLVGRYRFVAPAFVQSKRGRAIGAWTSQLAFVVPVLWVAPGGHPLLHTPWPWPLLGGLGAAGATLAGIPLFLGQSGLYAALTPQGAASIRAAYDAVCGALLAADAWAVVHLGPTWAWAGVLIALLGQEAATWHVHWRELLADPLYAPVSDGVKLLAVVPGSLADTMGLKPGEIITHINQVPVQTSYDLHFALDQNPAYAKLQVYDVRGEMRLVGKPVFSGERAKLGLILAPDVPGVPSYRRRRVGLFQTLYLKAQTSGNSYEDVFVDVDPAPPHQT
ncbi:PDZ domain-containing protein [Alicyclobacillus kakegawensis]|uniref:PDZ domain-containing protein n=1 Tax=Alicyclobacillus kakegawensis TaxID=392012 RepID=UPI000832183B|nr:PDZ domain-containing protein [Alicyclobacillus kakegawensis]